jgi:squalene-hopene/tetraprenyl-beta-curcumene cyclase
MSEAAAASVGTPPDRDLTDSLGLAAGELRGITAQSAVQSVVGRRGERHRIVRELVGGLSRQQVESHAELKQSGREFGAIDLTARWLLDQQAEDGHWRGPLEGDTILESEYLLILAWAGRLDDATANAACRRILQQQLDSGGWAIHPDGPVDVSASVKAYLALKIAGHDRNSEPLRRARLAIRDHGGPWAVNSFTRFYLALLGQIPYSACPAVPPEMVLLPTWFPINLDRVSAWSRTMIVPLSLMWAFKPVRQIPDSHGIGELFSLVDRSGPPPAGGSDVWSRFFRVLDRFIKACDAIGFRPLRSRAVAACRAWMLERFDGSDGLGAIFPPIVWSIVGLRAMGCEDDSPEVQECWAQLERLIEPQPDGSLRVEPCRSPVWDTAITLRGICDGIAAGADRGGVDRASLDAAVDWLLEREVRSPADSAGSTGVEPSGWCFQYANRFYPDVDDTVMVMIALAVWRDAVAGPEGSGQAASTSQSAASRRLARVGAALSRAERWVLAMQNSDGGWAAFDRDNNLELLCKVPFADHNAMIDPSTPDLAGRALEALGAVGLRVGHPAIDRGVAYLRESQEADGGWFGRWGVNYVYGTWQAVVGLRAVGVPADDPAVRAGADWLVQHQQPDGGWGETPASYADRDLAGQGCSTPSQTAWAVFGLVAAGRTHSRAAQRGVQWLVENQEFDGTWLEREFTGTGFPKVFYLRYHYYPIYFPLIALAKHSAAVRADAGSPAGTQEMVA